MQGAEDKARDTQVWSDLPCFLDRTGGSQVQGQDLTSAGSQMLPLHQGGCPRRIRRCHHWSGQQKQGGFVGQALCKVPQVPQAAPVCPARTLAMLFEVKLPVCAAARN